jgi:hypothetical protein
MFTIKVFAAICSIPIAYSIWRFKVKLGYSWIFDGKIVYLLVMFDYILFSLLVFILSLTLINRINENTSH